MGWGMVVCGISIFNFLFAIFLGVKLFECLKGPTYITQLKSEGTRLLRVGDSNCISCPPRALFCSLMNYITRLFVCHAESREGKIPEAHGFYKFSVSIMDAISFVCHSGHQPATWWSFIGSFSEEGVEG